MPAQSRQGSGPRSQSRHVHLLLEAAVALDPQELVTRTAELFGSASYRPPLLPGVAMEVLEEAGNPLVDLGRIAERIERDQMLAGLVLKRANAAVFAGKYPIRSVRDGITRLGIRTMRDLVIATALSTRVFRNAAYASHTEALRRHSLATALITRSISEHLSLDTEFAFLCGLMHDIGIATVLAALSETEPGEQAPDPALLWATIGIIHQHVGGIVARLWRLPDQVAVVVESHHATNPSSPLVAMVTIADALARDGGQAPALQRCPAWSDEDCALLDVCDDGRAVSAIAHLGLTDRQVESIRQAATRILIDDDLLGMPAGG